MSEKDVMGIWNPLTGESRTIDWSEDSAREIYEELVVNGDWAVEFYPESDIEVI